MRTRCFYDNPLLLVSFGIFALWLSRTGNDEENKVAACVRIDQVNYFSSFLSYLSLIDA